MPSLEALYAEQVLVCVCTRPDTPAGRGLKLKPTAVRQRAEALGLRVVVPARLDGDFVSKMQELRPDLLVCASYGKILPPALLAAAGLAALNVHPSLLPAYRGAAPIQAALRDGLDVTGVTLMWMSSEMDAGDIALQRSVVIAADDNYGTLNDKLAKVGASLLSEGANCLGRGALPRLPQDETKATYTRAISKQELEIDFGKDVKDIVNLIRSASPSPGAWMNFRGQRIKVVEARAQAHASGSPGELLQLEGPGPLFAAMNGALMLLRVVPQGKAPMSGAQFARTLQTPPAGARQPL